MGRRGPSELVLLPVVLARELAMQHGGPVSIGALQAWGWVQQILVCKPVHIKVDALPTANPSVSPLTVDWAGTVVSVGSSTKDDLR